MAKGPLLAFLSALSLISGCHRRGENFKKNPLQQLRQSLYQNPIDAVDLLKYHH